MPDSVTFFHSVELPEMMALMFSFGITERRPPITNRFNSTVRNGLAVLFR